MPKLDIEFELTGLKLKIKGESEDVTGKVADLQRQIQGLMGTVAALAQGGTAALPPAPDNGASGKLLEAPQAPAQLPAVPNNSRTPRKTPARKTPGSSPRQRAEAIDFKHDADNRHTPWSASIPNYPSRGNC